MKNEVKAKRSDNEQADSNDSDIALNGFLNLLDHDISNNPEKLVEVTEALTEEPMRSSVTIKLISTVSIKNTLHLNLHSIKLCYVSGMRRSNE